MTFFHPLEGGTGLFLTAAAHMHRPRQSIIRRSSWDIHVFRHRGVRCIDRVFPQLKHGVCLHIKPRLHAVCACCTLRIFGRTGECIIRDALSSLAKLSLSRGHSSSASKESVYSIFNVIESSLQRA